MKRHSVAISMVLLLVFGAAASAPAMAQHYGHGHGYGYGGVRFGIALGFPYYGPGYYPGYAYPAYGYPAPYYAYPGAAYAYPGAAAAGTYVERGPAQAAAPAQTQGDWYYCANSNAYYPHVKECPGGWQRVPSTPAR